MSHLRIWSIGLALLLLASNLVAADTIPFQLQNQVDPIVVVKVHYDVPSDSFAYTYGVTSLPSSRQLVFHVAVGTVVQVSNTTQPNLIDHRYSQPFPWRGSRLDATDLWPAVVSWGPADYDGALDPGERIDGLGFQSTGTPCIGTCYVQGAIPVLQPQQDMLPPPVNYHYTLAENSVSIQTVVPQPPPTGPFDASKRIDALRDLVLQAQSVGWIVDSKLIEHLLRLLDDAKSKVQTDRPLQAAGRLSAFSRALKETAGSEIDEPSSNPDGQGARSLGGGGNGRGRDRQKFLIEAYYLLAPTAAQVISKLAPTPPGVDNGEGDGRESGSVLSGGLASALAVLLAAFVLRRILKSTAVSQPGIVSPEAP